MKNFNKYKILILIIMLISPVAVNAQRGCCSHHGGVAGCSEDGRQVCRDGTLSPSCTCTPTVSYIYGCTDSSAKNYNSKANKDNGSCQYYIYGCTDSEAKNYNAKAEKDDGSCEYYVYGCIDKDAKNYNINAEKDDGSCEFYKYGCTDSEAVNYDENAEKDDDSCEYKKNIEEDSHDDSNGLLSVLTIGGIGAGIYYFKMKKNR